MSNAIEAKNMSKVYKIYENSKDKYLDLLFNLKRGTSFYALRDINLSIEKGTSLGLLGLNGSGKTTLANIISGATSPTNGEINVYGTTALSSVSGGLTGMLTGIENIEQQCYMLGMNKETIKEITPRIISFSELGRFIYQPVKNYSSGMRSRLSFSINVNIDPDILVIDEALSVGDETFSKKCLEKMQEFKQRKKTIIFVSHSLQQMREFCDYACWIEAGKIKQYGPSLDVISEYSKFITNYNSLNSKEKEIIKEDFRKRQFIKESYEKERKIWKKK